MDVDARNSNRSRPPGVPSERKLTMIRKQTAGRSSGGGSVMEAMEAREDFAASPLSTVQGPIPISAHITHVAKPALLRPSDVVGTWQGTVSGTQSGRKGSHSLKITISDSEMIVELVYIRLPLSSAQRTQLRRGQLH